MSDTTYTHAVRFIPFAIDVPYEEYEWRSGLHEAEYVHRELLSCIDGGDNLIVMEVRTTEITDMGETGEVETDLIVRTIYAIARNVSPTTGDTYWVIMEPLHDPQNNFTMSDEHHFCSQYQISTDFVREVVNRVIDVNISCLNQDW